MRLKEGRPFDCVALDADTAMLYQFFSDIRIERTNVAGRHRADDSPSPRTRSSARSSSTASRRSSGRRSSRLPIATRAGLPLDRAKLALDRADIVAAYRARATTTPTSPSRSCTPVEGGGQKVIFTVVEGPEVKVDRVIIRGNEHVPYKRILEAMQTKPSALFSSRTFNEETLREDLVEVRRLFRGEGYLDAEVVIDELRPSDDKEKFVVALAVVEGPRYVVGSVTVRRPKRETSGAGRDAPRRRRPGSTRGEPEHWLGLVVGEPYAGTVEDKGRERIKEEYFKRSYLEARVERAELRPRADGGGRRRRPRRRRRGASSASRPSRSSATSTRATRSCGARSASRPATTSTATNSSAGSRACAPPGSSSARPGGSRTSTGRTACPSAI